jgi:hypothetical protein
VGPPAPACLPCSLHCAGWVGMGCARNKAGPRFQGMCGNRSRARSHTPPFPLYPLAGAALDAGPGGQRGAGRRCGPHHSRRAGACLRGAGTGRIAHPVQPFVGDGAAAVPWWPQRHGHRRGRGGGGGGCGGGPALRVHKPVQPVGVDGAAAAAAALPVRCCRGWLPRGHVTPPFAFVRFCGGTATTALCARGAVCGGGAARAPDTHALPLPILCGMHTWLRMMFGVRAAVAYAATRLRRLPPPSPPFPHTASTARPSGGILADEMGMGKSLEVIALAMAQLPLFSARRAGFLKTMQPAVDPARVVHGTLVVCPVRGSAHARAAS